MPALVLTTTLAAVTALCGIIGTALADRAAEGVLQLPRPNSGTFSFEQAGARKFEILSNKPTKPLAKWKNPHLGFSIHIHSDDSITLYGRWVRTLGAAGKKLSVAKIKELAEALPLAGNPAGILVTSDKPLKESKVIHKILDALFVPSIQIFYVGLDADDKLPTRGIPGGKE